jgi:hypothetical protein
MSTILFCCLFKRAIVLFVCLFCFGTGSRHVAQVGIEPPTCWDYRMELTRAKWNRGVTQAVEKLLCKNKALSSNLSPIKKEKKGG